MKKDLREYGEQELSLIVFNDEGLYINRHSPEFIEAIIDEIFIYTDEQLKELKNDLLEDED